MSAVMIGLDVVDRLSRVMARVFQTDPAPAESRDILAAIADIVGHSRAIGFTIEPFSLRASVRACVGMDSGAAQGLLDGHSGVDPWLRGLMRTNIVGELVTVDDLRAAAGKLDRSGAEAYVRLLDALEITGCTGAIVRMDDGALVCMAVFSSAKETFSRASLELLNIIVRQLGYTAALRATRLAWDTERQLLATTLDLCHMPVFIVDGRGMIVRRNAAGLQMLAKGDVLQVKSGRLTAANSLDASRLAAQIARVTAPPPSELTVTWNSNSSAHEGVVAIISTLRLEDLSSISGQAFAVISIAERRSTLDGALPPGLLGELFGLTKAEDRIARLIADGRSASNVAELSGLSLATVRTHLSHIFEKTETGSQIELVRLLASLGPFRALHRTPDRLASTGPTLGWAGHKPSLRSDRRPAGERLPRRADPS